MQNVHIRDSDIRAGSLSLSYSSLR
jgi:hypothetical protein